MKQILLILLFFALHIYSRMDVPVDYPLYKNVVNRGQIAQWEETMVQSFFHLFFNIIFKIHSVKWDAL